MSHNTLVHRGLRRPVRALVHSPVTPDMLTTLRLLTGLSAAICFARAGGMLSAGVGLAFLSAILDRADGELARQSGRSSRNGPRFDLLADCVATMAIFIGLGAGLVVPVGFPDWTGLLLGVSGAISVALIFVSLNGVQMESAKPIGRADASALVDPDDIMLVLPFIIWLGGGSWIVLLSGLVTPVVAIAVAGLKLTWRPKLSGG